MKDGVFILHHTGTKCSGGRSRYFALCWRSETESDGYDKFTISYRSATFYLTSLLLSLLIISDHSKRNNDDFSPFTISAFALLSLIYILRLLLVISHKLIESSSRL